MGVQEERLKAIRYQHPAYIPTGVGILPAAWIKYRDELDALVKRHPTILGDYNRESRNYDELDYRHAEGGYTDAWGCGWSNIKAGQSSIVTDHPVPTRADVHTLKAPEEDIGFPHGFMFLRLTDLRGYAEMMMDFAEEPPELFMLLEIVKNYNVRQAELWAKQVGDDPIVYFGDDLGCQHALPISPEQWRTHLKPCFDAIYKPFRHLGKEIYMHTDGHILEIIPDLKDCGVTIVNPQIRANGVDGLERVCKGNICINLDLDRQMFPFCTPQEIFDQVEEVVKRLGSPEGGLWICAEVSDDVPLENIEAIAEALEKYRWYYS